MAVLNGGEDEVAIRSLTARFTDAVNRRAPDDVGGLFVADGTWVIPGLEDVTGPAAISARLAGLLDNFVFLVQILHSGVVVADGDRASARWFLSEFAQSADGRGWNFVGVYQDGHRRDAGGWRFARRRFDFLYRGPADVTGRRYPFPPLE